MRVEWLLGGVNDFGESETNKENQRQRPHPENRRVAAPRFVLLGYLCHQPGLYAPVLLSLVIVENKAVGRAWPFFSFLHVNWLRRISGTQVDSSYPRGSH